MLSDQSKEAILESVGDSSETSNQESTGEPHRQTGWGGGGEQLLVVDPVRLTPSSPPPDAPALPWGRTIHHGDSRPGPGPGPGSAAPQDHLQEVGGFKRVYAT